MWYWTGPTGDRPPARDALARESFLLHYDLVKPLEKIEQMLEAGDTDAAKQALSDFIRPCHADVLLKIANGADAK